MKKVVIVVIGCVALLAVLHLLSIERVLSAESLQKAVDETRNLSGLLFAKTIDFDLVKERYTGAVRPVVLKVDRVNDLRLDARIHDAMARGGEGMIPTIAGRLIDKTLLRVFFHLIQGDCNRLGQPESNKEAALQRMRIAYGVLEPEVIACGQWIGDGGALALRIAGLLDAVGSSDSGQAADAAKKLIENLKGVLVLSMLHRLESAQKVRMPQRIVALEFLAEAKMIYGAFYEDHANFKREGGIMVMGEFTKRPEKVDYPMMRRELAEAFTGFIPELTAQRFAPILEEKEPPKDQA